VFISRFVINRNQAARPRIAEKKLAADFKTASGACDVSMKATLV
jgi:hypothetical protein